LKKFKNTINFRQANNGCAFLSKGCKFLIRRVVSGRRSPHDWRE